MANKSMPLINIHRQNNRQSEVLVRRRSWNEYAKYQRRDHGRECVNECSGMYEETAVACAEEIMLNIGEE